MYYTHITLSILNQRGSFGCLRYKQQFKQYLGSLFHFGKQTKFNLLKAQCCTAVAQESHMDSCLEVVVHVKHWHRWLKQPQV